MDKSCIEEAMPADAMPDFVPPPPGAVAPPISAASEFLEMPPLEAPDLGGLFRTAHAGEEPISPATPAPASSPKSV